MNHPPLEVLIVAHGQPSTPAPPEAWLREFSVKVAAFLPGWRVRSATLAAPNSLERQLAGMSAGALVFPMFMSDGWFVSKVLPRRLQDAAVQILPPFGFLKTLPDLAANIAKNRMQTNGWDASKGHLLLAAHGSARGDKAAQSTYDFVTILRPRLPDMTISVGFIEQAPFLPDAAKDLPPQSLCLPFFALQGEHCLNDIPQSLTQANFEGDLLPPLGLAQAIPVMVADSIASTKNT